ncbi:MAG: polysaccharide pyruvyl transferase family protein [Paraprevotella sp.]|nr:polysaccharide pyruvyl transferase family protein [Paraprevotella sp.]
MKIGILTFHWAANYGAVLQTYALQSFLEGLGHKVVIVNYKPAIYDYTIVNFIKQREFRNVQEYFGNYKKYKGLNAFRKDNLHITDRIFSCSQIEEAVKGLDVLISGSDQVLNPYFLKDGEGRGIISPSYFLGFPYKGKKIAYAVSFGCLSYPVSQLEIAKKYLCKFDMIGVREVSGLDIARAMGGRSPIVVPDPTALLESSHYIELLNPSQYHSPSGEYYYAFFIRDIKQRRKRIPNSINNKDIIWNNDDNDYSLPSWLKKIYLSRCVITDSFHCVMMCLQLSKPFVVITNQPGKEGMNDRLYTLLEPMGLTHRILYKEDMERLPDCINSRFDVNTVNETLCSMRKVGSDFLKSI